VEQVAAYGSLVACAVGKNVHLYDGAAKLKILEHPSTVTGLAFDAKGKRIAGSHYNGATLWFVGAKVDSPRKLEWKGSHLGIAIHPAGEAVVTSMQENSLHGWRLADGQHMRMSGYPAKTAAMGFTRNGRWLASSGADTIVLWPFHGGGPMGKAPTELAGGDNVICTMVACHPQNEVVAAGFADGLVLLADVTTSRILPIAPPGHGSVTALAWSADGAKLAFGTESGFAALIDLSRR
jgi:WD40 repeat protein